MSKKNIETWTDRDPRGLWRLNIRRKRGQLTLDEIRDTCMEWEEDFYLLVIKAMSGDMEQYYDVEDLNGDYVQIYRAYDFFDWREK